MKLLFIKFLLVSQIVWLSDFTVAKQQAHDSHKLILVNFSGSDWCIPCISLRKEILESPEFESYAKDNLILLRADFPRQKKNQLPKDQVKRNEALADKYNADGKFPFTLLVDGEGKVLKSWDGYPDENATQFINEIKSVPGAAR